MIKVVPIDLQNRPAWYKEKVYPENKVIFYCKYAYLKHTSLSCLNFLIDHQIFHINRYPHWNTMEKLLGRALI